MAHLYTIRFQYEGTNNLAVVYEKNDMVKVTLYDEPLYAILPGGKFSFNADDKVVLEENLPSCAQNLSSIIISCIEKRKQLQTFIPTVLNA